MTMITLRQMSARAVGVVAFLTFTSAGAITPQAEPPTYSRISITAQTGPDDAPRRPVSSKTCLTPHHRCLVDEAAIGSACWCPDAASAKGQESGRHIADAR